MKRDFSDFIQDMIDAIISIDIFTKNKSYDDFVNDDLLFSAVARKFEIIGEAANRIPKAFQEKYPEIPWYEIVGMRNIIIHDYDGINKPIMWDTLKDDLSSLTEPLQRILEHLKT